MLVAAAVMVGPGAAIAVESGPATMSAEPGRDDIRRVVGDLGHPVPSRRQAARRQLVRWGPRVIGELRRAAEGQNLETALAARDVLEELDGAFFQGGQVTLEVDRTTVDWDEPFALTVVVHNPTSGPIRVSWAAPTSAAAGRPTSEDVVQVGAMLDVADFLSVRDAQGDELELRMDPIERDPAVRAAVEQRARGTPHGSLVEPGGTARLRIADFNRGWARFPMLTAGKYTIALCYQPPWRDETWVAEKLGMTETPPVEIEVRRAAPEAIRDANRPLRLWLTPSDGDLVAELHNLWDRPQQVNLDLGPDVEVQARLEWRVTRAGRAGAEPMQISPLISAPARTDLMPLLRPNERIEIARVSRGGLWDSLRAAGVSRPGSFDVLIRYQFLIGAEQLRAASAARRRKVDVQTCLFTGAASSDEVRIRLPGSTNPAR